MFTRLLRRSVARRVSRRAGLPAFVWIETLEELQLLSASSVLSAVATPLVTTVAGSSTSAAASTKQATPLANSSSPQGYTPAQIAQAYGFNQITFDGGTLKGNGAGQTIAIVDAYVDPNIASDLAKFDSQFGLAAPASFTQYVEQGATANSGWDLETSLDVEWAHAIAPGANIVLVEANNSSLSSLLSAVNYARDLSNVSVVSMSWGASEFSSETAYDSYFTTPAGHSGITFVASSGDGGAGTTWPSVSPNVLAVGGTTLNTTASGNYVNETAWSDSGGGVSSFETEPSYQTSVESTGKRTTPDVAYDANPNTGFAVYDSVAYAGQSGWFEVGGTSAGAPQWAALIAIADQGRGTANLAPLSNANSLLYSLPQSEFHDITSGSNGYPATTGYDLVTGRGSPVLTTIMRDLTSSNAAATQTAAVIAASSTQSARADAATSESPVSSAGAAIVTVNPSVDWLEATARPGANLSAAVAVDRVVADQSPQGAAFIAPATVDPSLVHGGADVPITASSPDIDVSSLWSPAVRVSAAQPGVAGFAGGPDTAASSQATANSISDDLANSSGRDSVIETAEEGLSARAIDAYFASAAVFTEPTTPVLGPTHSSGAGKAAVVGVATSAGLITFWARRRAKRREAAGSE